MASEVADIEGIVVDEQDATQNSRIVAVEPFASEDAFEVVVFAVVVAVGYGSTTADFPMRRGTTIRCRRPCQYSTGLEYGWQ